MISHWPRPVPTALCNIYIYVDTLLLPTPTPWDYVFACVPDSGALPVHLISHGPPASSHCALQHLYVDTILRPTPPRGTMSLLAYQTQEPLLYT